MELILAEQTLLIALDDQKGRDTTRWGSDAGLAAALLAEAHAAIAASGRRRDAKGWVGRLPRDLKPLRKRVAHGLVERGVLSEETSKLLGLVPTTRFPASDPAPERELRERLDAVLLGGGEPTASEALLIGLLEPLGLIDTVVDKGRRREARKRAKEVAEQGLAGTAVRDSVRAVQAAVLTAVIVSSTTASAS